MVLSELPLTTSRSRYCRHAMPRLCPFRVRTNSQVEVFHTYTTIWKHLTSIPEYSLQMQISEGAFTSVTADMTTD